MGIAENAILLSVTNLLAYYKLRWFRNKVSETNRKYNSKNPYYTDKGILDISVFLPDGKILFVEAKTDEGKLSKDQIDFIEICKANNTPYLVVTDVSQVELYLKSYFAGTEFYYRFR